MAAPSDIHETPLGRAKLAKNRKPEQWKFSVSQNKVLQRTRVSVDENLKLSMKSLFEEAQLQRGSVPSREGGAKKIALLLEVRPKDSKGRARYN